ncbi:hypothetical protein ACWD11_33795 [Streptomyces sp. NPDC002776]
MTDGLRWVYEAYPYGYSLGFCEALTPEEVLERLGVQRESVFPLTAREAREIETRNAADEPNDLDHLDDLDVEAVEELGFLRPSTNAVIRAGSTATEGWSVAIQASVSYVSAVSYLPRSPGAPASSRRAWTRTPYSGWSTRWTGVSCRPSTHSFRRTTTVSRAVGARLTVVRAHEPAASSGAVGEPVRTVGGKGLGGTSAVGGGPVDDRPIIHFRQMPFGAIAANAMKPISSVSMHAPLRKVS